MDDLELLSILRRAARMTFRNGSGRPRSPFGHALEQLARGDGMRQSELADALGVRAASLSEMLSKMEARGLVTRTPDETDRRRVIVRLTPEGEALRAKRQAGRARHAEELFGALSETEKQTLARLLETVMKSAGEREGRDE